MTTEAEQQIKTYAITICWDDRYVVAPATGTTIEEAIASAYEWAENGGYESQDTFDCSGETYIGHIAECADLDKVKCLGPFNGGPGLPIPFKHSGDTEQLDATRKAARAMLKALKLADGALDALIMGMEPAHVVAIRATQTAILGAMLAAQAVDIIGEE